VCVKNQTRILRKKCCVETGVSAEKQRYGARAAAEQRLSADIAEFCEVCCRMWCESEMYAVG